MRSATRYYGSLRSSPVGKMSQGLAQKYGVQSGARKNVFRSGCSVRDTHSQTKNNQSQNLTSVEKNVTGRSSSNVTVTAEEKERFQIAWNEGLRQMEEKFDSWMTAVPEELLSTDAVHIWNDAAGKVTSAGGLAKKFLALREVVVTLLVHRNLESESMKELPDSNDLHDVYDSLSRTQFQLKELQATLRSVELNENVAEEASIDPIL